MKHHPRLRWNGERCARLGVLATLGYTPDEAAQDPFIQSTADAVRRAAGRLGIAFRDRPVDALPPSILAIYDREAERYGVPGKQLIKLVLTNMTRDRVGIETLHDFVSEDLGATP